MEFNPIGYLESLTEIVLSIKKGGRNNTISVAHKKEWLRPADLEIEYGILKSSQAKLRMDKKIPYSKIGNFVHYNREKINNWLNEHEM
jgi:hypothetical protein